MKILLVYDYLSEVGGIERIMATHTHWLKEKGHEVKMVFNFVNQEILDYEFLKGTDIRESGSLKHGGEAIRVFSALFFNKLKKYDADLVIAYSFPSLFTTRNLKAKKIFHYLPMEFVYFPVKKRWSWANDSKRKLTFFATLLLGPFLKILDKVLIKDKLVLSLSEFTQKEVKERYGVDSAITYAPLGSVFRPSKKPSETLKKYNLHNKFVLTAGRIIPDKRTDWLIEIFSKLKDKKLDFVIAGQIEPTHKEELVILAKKFGVTNRVKMLGLVSQKELIDLYTASEAFIFASVKEAFGLVPVEAMACGVPVVAWKDEAGPNEYVLDGVNGYFAKPYDLDDFVDKAEKLLDGNFKKKNKKKIIDSSKKFSEKEQKDIFLKAVGASR